MPDRSDKQHVNFFTWTYDDGSQTHLLPADEGAFSLEGISHAAKVATHYIAEGRVRHRAPFSEKFDIYIAPPQPGSWTADFIMSLSKPDTWAGAVAGIALTSFAAVPIYAYKLLRRIANRATGVLPSSDETSIIEEVYQGNFDALVDAATPSLTRAHRVIRSSNTTLQLKKDDLALQFDLSTKLYIETNFVDDHTSEAVGNTAGYSVNQRTGRIYMDELRRTVPFLLHREAPERASVALARSLEAYASTRAANSDLVFRYQGTRAQDGRLKKILIFDARFAFGVSS
jgi:hypothetical protein